MDQSKTPLYDKVMEHQKKSPISFHVPGHKNGSVFNKMGKDIFEQILRIDVTEIEGMDDLHQPDGVIQEAQDLAANLYGVKDTFFLVGGSTVGNLAAIMSSLKTGDKVIVQRNSHQSVFHGIELAGATPVFIHPDVDVETGLSLGVSKYALKETIERFPMAKAIILTNPTYEGYGQPLDDHVELAHHAGMIVIIDEAHGAHLVLKDSHWPVSSIHAGADIIIQSAHKMLPAMTMTAFLHINSSRINKGRVKNYLRMLQSSSPSYPLMVSLDLGRAYLAKILESDWSRMTDHLLQFKEGLNRGDGWVRSPNRINQYVQDPLKLVFVADEYISTDTWKEKMESLNVFPELVTPNHILLTLPLTVDGLATADWTSLMKRSLLGEKNGYVIKRDNIKKFTVNENESIFSEAVVPLSQLLEMEVFKVPWTESIGLVAAETITPYPPGIPLIMKGEYISEYHIVQLHRHIENKTRFQTGDSWFKDGISVVMK
ncbi:MULTISPECIES: aminotransferase class I/II-fold pyridoxal phosphate-dependent enzyme [Bacillaceae]|uniref:Aminotransferase class V-fold PLP-dependent enzyme n=1 Tax=Evansella alkalicola TaxID=745819 RepID=A0ABS6JTU1_9BACI|nr:MULTISPECIES: aminotransferase class I/II-fold pyridoxal phosphate-dependent enzyme [Bacillaceae]MBU9721971.1 aminotransferase class V-fold PLP-dependent enzyme [Bacillus alkalicola]